MRDDVPWLFSLVSRFALRRSHAGLKRTERIVDASNVLLTNCKVIGHDWIDRVSFLQLGTGMVFTLYYLHLFTMYFSIYESTWFNMIQPKKTTPGRRTEPATTAFLTSMISMRLRWAPFNELVQQLTSAFQQCFGRFSPSPKGVVVKSCGNPSRDRYHH